VRNSTPRAFISSYERRQSSVANTPAPSAPFATIARMCSADSGSSIGGPGTARISSKSGWPGGPTVSQRKVSIVTSVRASKPSTSV
jgi:hypothetical protein